GGRVGDLPPGFGQRLALLGSHDFRQILLVTHDQLEPAAQYGGALLGGTFAPGRLRGLGRLDGAAGFLRSHVRHAAQFLAGSGVEDIGSPALVGLAPDTVDKGLLAEQFGGLQFHGILLLCGGVTHLPRPRLIFRTCYAERHGQTSGGEKKARAGAGSYRAARTASARSCTVLFDVRLRATHCWKAALRPAVRRPSEYWQAARPLRTGRPRAAGWPAASAAPSRPAGRSARGRPPAAAPARPE